MENESVSWTNDELAKFVQATLPEFFKSVVENPDVDIVIMHQDAFAADLQSHELLLLGACIKFAGNYKKEVRIIGQNRETLI